MLFLILNSLIGSSQIPEANNPEKHPYQINKWFVDSLDNKPISFYLNHPNIDKYSKLFYEGKFAASDDDLTFAFLDSVLTKNTETKSFYLFIYNSVLRITDGALSEYMGYNCRKYLEKYPCSFINLKNNKLYANNYQSWIDFSAYEYYNEEYPIEIVKEEFELIRIAVNDRCEDNSTELEYILLRIVEFVNENK